MDAENELKKTAIGKNIYKNGDQIFCKCYNYIILPDEEDLTWQLKTGFLSDGRGV